jgi:hypothetical protein
MKNLADCWWQIPPFGKDFQAVVRVKMAENPKDSSFRVSGMPVAYLGAGLGAYDLEFRSD